MLPTWCSVLTYLFHPQLLLKHQTPFNKNTIIGCPPWSPLHPLGPPDVAAEALAPAAPQAAHSPPWLLRPSRSAQCAWQSQTPTEYEYNQIPLLGSIRVFNVLSMLKGSFWEQEIFGFLTHRPITFWKVPKATRRRNKNTPHEEWECIF